MSTANDLYNRTVAKDSKHATRNSHEKGYNHERLVVQAMDYGYEVNDKGQLKHYVVGVVLNSSAEKEGQLTKDMAKVYLRNPDEEVEFRKQTFRGDTAQLKDKTVRQFRERDAKSSLQKLAQNEAEILAFDYPRVESSQEFVDADGNVNSLKTISAKWVKGRVHQPSPEDRQAKGYDRVQLAMEGMANIALTLSSDGVPRARVELIERVDSLDIQPKHYDEKGQLSNDFQITRSKVVGLFQNALQNTESQNYLVPNEFTPIDKNGERRVHNDSERTGMLVLVLKENNLQEDGTYTKDPLNYTLKIFPERKSKFKGRDANGNESFVSAPDDPLITLSDIMACRDKPSQDYIQHPTDANFEKAFSQDVARLVLGHIAGYATHDEVNPNGRKFDYVTTNNPQSAATLDSIARKMQDGSISIDIISGRKLEFYAGVQNDIATHLKPQYFEAYPGLNTDPDKKDIHFDPSLVGYTEFEKVQNGDYSYTQARHKFAPTMLLLSPISQGRNEDNTQITASPGTLMINAAFSMNLRGPRKGESCYYEDVADFVKENPQNLANRGRVTYCDPANPGPNPVFINQAIHQYLQENPLSPSADVAEQRYAMKQQATAEAEFEQPIPSTAVAVANPRSKEQAMQSFDQFFNELDKDTAQPHASQKPDFKSALDNLLADIEKQRSRQSIVQELANSLKGQNNAQPNFDTMRVVNANLTAEQTSDVTHEQEDVNLSTPSIDYQP